MDAKHAVGRLRWPDAQFAFTGDPRLSYCMHIPKDFRETDDLRLLVAVHGTSRDCMALRDAFAPFADASRYVVLAPLFPAGVLGDDNADGYKYLAEGDIRYDRVLLGMVAEVEQIVGARFDRFDLFGFSGGAHFAHRFFYLHPDHLNSVVVGAPGSATLLDGSQDFWRGTRDFEARFGSPIDLAAMKRVRSLLLVGSEDTEPFVIPPHLAHHAAAIEALGRNRVERNATLLRNWRDHGLPTQQVIVPGVAHEGLKMVSEVGRFLRSAPPTRTLP